MEVSGLVFQISSPASAAVRQFSGGILRLVSSSSVHSNSNSNSKNSTILLLPKLRLSSVQVSAATSATSSAFSDSAHLDYYNKKKVKSMEKELTCTKKTLKKKLKLIKGLSKNLSAFSDMGFGLDQPGADADADPGLAYQVKAKMISEATELLLGQLQQLKAEEMELKKKKKQDKAKLRAAAASSRMMQKRMGQEDDSSSSSSSDSECEGDVVDLNSLKGKTPCFVSKGGLDQQQQVVINQQAIALPSTTEIRVPGNNVGQMGLLPAAHNNSDANCCSSSFDGNMATTGGLSSNIVGSYGGNNNNNLVEVVEACAPKKIEVCMGGKCKKSGAGSLLEEFQKAVGGEIGGGASVVGCKCMGKCRDGPNVRVVDAAREMEKAPLCIGVGLEDVGLIVSNFFGGGGNHQQSSSSELGLGLAAAS